MAVSAFQVGLVGNDSKVVWVGNIPESSAHDTAIRLLFGDLGDIRRVYMRKKLRPSMSWCLLMFRSSESAAAALNTEPPVVIDSDGTKISLLVEHPNIEKELSKANPGALGTVLGQALNDSLEEQDGGGQSPKSTRRRSAAEIEVRRSVTTDQSVEQVSALGSEQATKRSGWNRVRNASVRNKLAAAASFVQNDEANEQAAKAAIAAKMKRVAASEPETTNTVRALAELYRGELRGLDYRFKTAASLFRKIMARLDATLAENAMAKEKAAPPSPADILDSILDILRYTAVSVLYAAHARRDRFHAFMVCRGVVLGALTASTCAALLSLSLSLSLSLPPSLPLFLSSATDRGCRQPPRLLLFNLG